MCTILGMPKPGHIVDRLDDDEKGVHLVHTPGGDQKMAVVNEPGLYSVILCSDKPEAKPFRSTLPL